MAENQSKLIQIIHGIREIKLNNAERTQSVGMERHTGRALQGEHEVSLSLNQYQEAGGVSSSMKQRIS
jgi:ATP-binding cassette subfamily B protein